MKIEVFVSYASEDLEIAKSVVDYFKLQGINVWWDRAIPANHPNYRDVINDAVDDARCVLVIWTDNSVVAMWPQAEAEIALQQGKLICIRINSVKLRAPFNSCPYKDISVSDNKVSDIDLTAILLLAKKLIGIIGPLEHLISPRRFGEAWDWRDLALEGPVPGTGIFVSFRPCDKAGLFLLTRLNSTSGWVSTEVDTSDERHDRWVVIHSRLPHSSGNNISCDERENQIFLKNKGQYKDARTGKEYLRVDNEIFFIRDPIRPFGIQIGGLRTKRPGGRPDVIKTNLTTSQLLDLASRGNWLCMVLASVLTDTNLLESLWQYVDSSRDLTPNEKEKIKHTISQNTYAPKCFQLAMCLFCDEDNFVNHRRLSSPKQEDEFGAYIMANDFPFGSYFHYIVVVRTNNDKDPIHHWEDLTFLNIRGMNMLAHEFLLDSKNRCNSAGVEYGFNSTVRHIVLGERTHSSAGASIPHIHKQCWGLPPKTSNLAEQLIEVSQAYSNQGIDYLGCYMEAMREAGYVIWEDDYVMLYIPYGQCSMYEMQIMVKEPKGNFVALSQNEVLSLSVAEHIVLQLYKAIKVITSFNHIVLSKLDNDSRAPFFRVIEAFITREVDLAVSELSLLYVVDQHPWESLLKVKKIWQGGSGTVGIKRVIFDELEKILTRISDVSYLAQFKKWNID